MAFKLVQNIQEARVQIQSLVDTYKGGIKGFKQATYNETLLRNDFLNPLLLSLGWDVFNENDKTPYKRDVRQEESIEVEGSKAKKSPDYTLRVNGIRTCFVEAKKPSVDVSSSQSSAFQTRRYGWNASLNISVLSNFEYLVVYDCRHKPTESDDERVARYKVYHFEEYIENIEEIYSLLSYQSVRQGCLNTLFENETHQTESFDQHFLNQISNWRKELAIQIHSVNKISVDDLNLLTQKLINRVIFLRICEDRNFERFETLKNIKTIQELKEYFQYADKKYDSGLFDLIEDQLTLNMIISDELIVSIFQELYFPYSPYDFSVIDSTILSQIYEKFLGNRIEIHNGNPIIIEEPEVSASKGVVPTPELLSVKIVKDCLDEVTANKNIEEIQQLKIADICCGSGTFLLQAYEYLINKTLEAFIEAGDFDSDDIAHLGDGEYELSLEGKINVILNNIYGVDINPYAVEVASFGLCVKILEGESPESIEYYVAKSKNRVLPNLAENLKTGNSLIDDTYFIFQPDAADDLDLISKIAPFNWKEEFPTVFEQGGFDAIVGNPPYVRIQNLVKYTPEEIKFYKSKEGNYHVANKYSIDKYYVFIERAISLINDKGNICYIIPSKFAKIKSGEPLRKLISTETFIHKITHFGTTQAFDGHTTYTAIIQLTKEHRDNFLFKPVKDITAKELFDESSYYSFKSSQFAGNPWVFFSSPTGDVFNKIYTKSNATLGEISNIVVGVQTSADDIYIFVPESEDENYFYFTREEQPSKVEKNICKPCIYDLTFKKLDTIEPNAQMIFPYDVDGDHAELIDEDSFLERYPVCWDYLQSHKARLLERKFNGAYPVWYQFGRSQSLAKFEDDEKLIWPVLSLDSNYVLDHSNILFTGGGNGPYYALTRKVDLSLKYLLGILMHPVIESIVKARASEFRGDYYSHGKQFLENLPFYIPKSEEDKVIYNKVISLVERGITLNQQLPYISLTKRKAAQLQIHRLHLNLISEVSKIYSITEEDIRTVLSDEVLK
ncbi:Eco57I restriction-modification methylase domain-containing protein [Thalassotalea piscium]